MTTKQNKLARNLRSTFHARLCGALGAAEVVETFLANAQESLDVWQSDANEQQLLDSWQKASAVEQEFNAAHVLLTKLITRLRDLEASNRLTND
jgi:hypothetical protein